MNRNLFFLLFLFLTSFPLYSQTVTISGILQDEGMAPLEGVDVTALGSTTQSDETGFFKLILTTNEENITLIFSRNDETVTEKTVSPHGQDQVSLGVIYLDPSDGSVNPPSSSDLITGEDRIPTITLSEGEEESELGQQNISGILSASRDPFVAAAAFNLSSGGFDIRGFRTETTVLFNGMPFNNIENGSVYWSIWGGLNDVTRNRESAIDLSANSWTFGGIGGYTVFDTRASEQRTGTRMSYMFSNRSYTGRLMASHSTGMMKNGWAFTVSGSKRWAEEGYVPGTFYDAHSYFASVDRKIGEHHLLNLTAFGSPIRRGSQGASIQAANDLAGTNFYNPNWGYQAGEKRNARVVDAHQPVFILRHDWKIGDKHSVMTSAGYQFGHYGRTALDWFNAPDPRGDYYRNLPFFHALENQEAADAVEQVYLNNPDLLQIQWDAIYRGNVSHGYSYEDTPGIWSQVILANQRSDATRMNASSTYEGILNDHVTINGGLTFQREETHYFKTAQDMLGGDYYLNLNRFALDDERLQLNRFNPAFHDDLSEVAMFNLEDENVIVREGDTYGWNYDITGRRANAWLQGQFTFRKIDFFLAGSLTDTEFWRTGYYRSGQFPENSLGESEKQHYFNYGAKAGVTYKFDGRNYLYANGALLNRAPDPRIAYASPRNRDQIVPGLTDEKVQSFEAGFQHRSPMVKARATFFHTRLNDGMKLNRFFLPGDISNFGTYILTNLDERHMGIELAAQVKLSQTLSANLAGAIGEYKYTSRPNGVFIQDDDGVIRDRGTIYVKDFYVPGAPQTAMSFGLDYRSPKFWSLSITANYFDDTYIDFSPERRTEEQVFGLDPASDLYREITDQVNVFDEDDIGFKTDHFTIDLFAYKSFKVDQGMYFSLMGGVTNLLNATVIQGGYEQLRFDRVQVAETGVNLFPPRFFFAYGTNFFVMGVLRF